MTGINIQLLSPLAKVPTKGTRLSAGYDLYAATDTETYIEPHQTVMVSTDIALAIPVGTFGAIFARSGLASKYGLRPANCVGVIDPDYRGTIMVALHNDTDHVQVIGAGERIAKLFLLPYFETNFVKVDKLQGTTRGSGGFGSTGKV